MLAEGRDRAHIAALDRKGDCRQPGRETRVPAQSKPGAIRRRRATGPLRDPAFVGSAEPPGRIAHRRCVVSVVNVGTSEAFPRPMEVKEVPRPKARAAKTRRRPKPAPTD